MKKNQYNELFLFLLILLNNQLVQFQLVYLNLQVHLHNEEIQSQHNQYLIVLIPKEMFLLLY